MTNNKDKNSRETYAPKQFAQTAVVTLLTVLVTIMLAVLLNRTNFSKNFDLTTNKINSLTQETSKFLSSLETTVQIICIPGQNIADSYCDSTNDLLKLYEKTNSHIINLGALDLRDQSLLSRVQPSGFSRLVLMTTNNKSELSGNVTESRLTNAIVNLIKFKKTIHFLSGHGEPGTVASAERNYADVVTALESKAYSVKTFNTQDGTIPDDARVLIAGDNSIPYDAGVEAELTKFVLRGGKLVLVVNPYREQGLKNLYTLLNLKADNILLTLNQNTPLGKQLAKQNLLRPPVIMSDFSTESPITDVIAQAYGAQASIPIDGARPISILEDKQESAQKTKSVVLMSAVQAAPITLTEAQRNKINLQKPFALTPDKSFDEDETWPIGVDVTLENKSEVVVYGFSLVNPYSTQVRVTEELLPMTVAHLYEDKELIAIPAREFAPKQFNYSRNPGAWLIWFAGFLPFCTALMGIFIWMRRRTA